MRLHSSISLPSEDFELIVYDLVYSDLLTCDGGKMLKQLLEFIVELIAKIHDKILSINDKHDFGLNDKQLHLVVIGLLGFAIFLCVHSVFKWLSKRSITAISWIYTFTVIVVITFAIEIGQHVSNTGRMSFSDIAYGIWGFLLTFVIYLIIRYCFKGMKRPNEEREKRYIGQNKRK